MYSFAASGAPLSQYLAWAQHAADAYRAQGSIFLIVGNDFDESLASVKQGPGFHHFFAADDELELRLVPYEPNPLREVVYNTALGRYLVFHLQALSLPDRIAFAWRQTSDSEPVERRYAGNTAYGASEERLVASKRAVDAFLDEWPKRTAWQVDRVLFILDGIRGIQRMVSPMTERAIL